ncbi:MAG: ketopantoate reductase family protein [bacterium]
MRVVVLGGAGAMGGVFGSRLARAGHDVTLVDVWAEAVDAINAGGLRLQESSGAEETVRVRAVTRAVDAGPADLIVVFVKCYDTETAVRAIAPLMDDHTLVLSLQNGWGNGSRIGAIVGEDRVLAGVTYHSATVLGPGCVQHTGRGPTLIGELNGTASERAVHLAANLTTAGLEASATSEVVKEIWSKLALNATVLPVAALLGFRAGRLIEHEGTLDLMRVLLRETVSVANKQGTPLDYDERWQAITSLLQRAAAAKPSMLQDVERRRRTEVEVINGAVVAAGQRMRVPTPNNQAMVWLLQSLQETF